MSGVPRVAPYESCIACFKGDTTTALLSEGDAEWHIVTLMKGAGLTQAEAVATFRLYAEQDLGCDPGMVPDGRFVFGHRLCRECARKTGAKVVELGESGPAYVQPSSEP